MRSYLSRQALVASALRPADTAATACAASAAWSAYGSDTDVMNNTAACAEQALADGILGPQLSQVWADAEAGIQTSEEIVGAIDTVYAIIQTGILLTANTAVSLATVGTAALAAAGLGAELGFIGAFIGAFVGAVVGFVGFFQLTGCTVQITTGVNVPCTSYSTNLTQAMEWIGQNPLLLGGLTPLGVAKKWNIFLANPTWMYLNQANLAQMGNAGFTQPSPPDAGSGSTTDVIYSQLPGAFEILNRAQLIAATGILHLCPTKLAIWSTVYPPGVPGLTVTTPPTTWTPLPNVSGQLQGFPGSSGSGGFTYDAPYNLTTNDSQLTVYLEGGLVGAQTAPPIAVYFLQTVYPALTYKQCQALFATVQPKYEAVLQAAQAWANSQCYPPTAAQLGSGSTFSLEPSDVAAITAAYAYNGLVACPPQTAGAPLPKNQNPGKGGATTSTTTATTVLKGASLVAGLGAIGVAIYAAHSGVSVLTATKTLFSKTKSLLPKRVSRR